MYKKIKTHCHRVAIYSMNSRVGDVLRLLYYLLIPGHRTTHATSASSRQSSCVKKHGTEVSPSSEPQGHEQEPFRKWVVIIVLNSRDRDGRKATQCLSKPSTLSLLPVWGLLGEPALAQCRTGHLSGPPEHGGDGAAVETRGQGHVYQVASVAAATPCPSLSLRSTPTEESGTTRPHKCSTLLQSSSPTSVPQKQLRVQSPTCEANPSRLSPPPHPRYQVRTCHQRTIF